MKRRRSSSVGCANREKLFTQRTRSSPSSLRKASTAGLDAGSSVYVPVPKARFCLRISIIRFVQCSREDGEAIPASTFVTW